MNKTVPAVTDAKVTKINWKAVKDVTVALAPTVITVIACAVIVKQLDKE